MKAKIQLLGLMQGGNEKIIETVYAGTHSDAIYIAAEKITDLFFMFPYRNTGKFTKYYVKVDLLCNCNDTEIILKTLLPFTWERIDGVGINIFFFNDYFMHKVNNAVIDCLDRNFIESMVRRELEKINITNL